MAGRAIERTLLGLESGSEETLRDEESQIERFSPKHRTCTIAPETMIRILFHRRALREPERSRVAGMGNPELDNGRCRSPRISHCNRLGETRRDT